MSQPPISVTLLFDPTSSANGKFYVGVEDDRCPMTAHGPGSKGASGTWSKLSSAHAVRKKLTEKENKNYSPASASAIPPKVFDTLYDRISKALGIPTSSLSFSNGFVTIDGAGAGSGAGSSKPRKPRRRNTQHINVWI
jgi:hypothetical protein